VASGSARGARLLQGQGLEVAPLVPALRTYDWGSRTFLAELQGRPVPSPTVEAELWFGAHPSAPAAVERAAGAVGLDVAIAGDPAGELGADVVDRFGPRLPFLVKLLAMERPLSVQLHPSAEDALIGFEDEEQRGVPRDAAVRSFPDPWGKHEVLIALGPTRARAGLRAPGEVRAVLGALAPSVLDLVLAPEGVGRDGRQDLLGPLASVLGADEGTRRDALVALVDGARSVLEAGPATVDAGVLDEATTVLRLAHERPGDVGILVAVLLDEVALEPGDALVVPTGALHSYQHGLGLEIMVASDCVVRFGLTGKHVHAEEALAFVRPAARPQHLVRSAVEDGWSVLPCEREEFWSAATVLDDAAQPWPSAAPRLGPAVIVCEDGTVEVVAGADRVEVGAGNAAFVSARARKVTLQGEGAVRIVCVGASGGRP
jgi:mannose-6-phosphate isomerase